MKRNLSDALILDFAYKYATNHNAKESALSIGYTEKQATRMGYYLTHHPKVVEKIKKIEADLFAQAGASPQKRAFVLASRAVIPITQVCAWEGNTLMIKDSKELTPAEAAAIKKVKMERKTTTKGKGEDRTVDVIETMSIEMYDGIAAEELIARESGEIPREPQAPVNVPILVIHSHAGPSNGG